MLSLAFCSDTFNTQLGKVFIKFKILSPFLLVLVTVVNAIKIIASCRLQSFLQSSSKSLLIKRICAFKIHLKLPFSVCGIINFLGR